ncbi:MAG TPA: MBL fold metallo-hydrolase [Clostridia bacterium]|nr:MBL fold metallo-hydrolase [Clostridia bacterium]
MKLTVLGCNGPFPEAGEACSGYLLQSGWHSLLLDCGSGVLSKLARHLPFAALDGLVLTHLHADHMADVLVLRYALEFARNGGERTQPLPVWRPSEPTQWAALLEGTPVFEIHEPISGTLGPWRLSFLPVRHPVPAYAVRAEADGRALVYTGDTNVCPGLGDFAKGADVLLADAAFPRERWRAELPHMSAWHAGELAAQARAGRLLLTHFAPGSDRALLQEQARESFASAACAQPGLSVEI